MITGQSVDTQVRRLIRDLNTLNSFASLLGDELIEYQQANYQQILDKVEALRLYYTAARDK